MSLPCVMPVDGITHGFASTAIASVDSLERITKGQIRSERPRVPMRLEDIARIQAIGEVAGEFHAEQFVGALEFVADSLSSSLTLLPGFILHFYPRVAPNEPN